MEKENQSITLLCRCHGFLLTSEAVELRVLGQEQIALVVRSGAIVVDLNGDGTSLSACDLRTKVARRLAVCGLDVLVAEHMETTVFLLDDIQIGRAHV